MIITLPVLSGNADRNGLLDWVNGFQKKPEKIFVVHGEDSVCNSFVETLQQVQGLEAYAPFSGTTFDISKNLFETVADPMPIKKKTKIATDVFTRLMASGQRLLAVIRKNEGGANKDLAKLADQINSLCDKWDR